MCSSGIVTRIFHKGTTSLGEVLFYFRPLNRWLWQAPSLINDQWRTVSLRNGKHITIQLLILHRQVNETAVIMLHQNQSEREILYGCSFCQRAQLNELLGKKKVFSRMGENSLGLPAVGIFIYDSGMKLRVFSMMFTGFNNDLTSLKESQMKITHLVSKLQFRVVWW